MLHNQIDLTKPPQKAKLSLAKPNKQIVAILTEAYNIQYYPKLGNISELNFTIPAHIEDNHQSIPNPHFSMVRDFYLIKLEIGLFTEWFIINQPKKNADDNADVKNLTAFSLGYELKYKRIKDYSVTSYTPQQVLTDALSGTIWNVGTIASSISSLYRSFDVTSTTSILDFVLQVATTFDAVVVWDTDQRTVSLHGLNEIGIDRGLHFSTGNLLTGVEVDYDSDNIVTRLHCYGKDGLTLNSVNPSGTNYLEDFTYFLDDYAEDSNGNVISHSAYMSDGLCHAQIAYQNLLESKKNDFSTLLTQLQGYQTTLTQQQTDLDNLTTQMQSIQDQLDVAQSTGQSTTSLLQQQSSQQALIDAKNNDIATTQANIDTVNSQISTLQSQISIENNFTADQITERSQYIFEQDYVNDNIIDPQDLYDLASTEFEKLRTPQISVKIDIVNFLEILEEQVNWDKLNLGDIVYIYHEKLDVDIKAKIIEYQIDFEQGSITLTIANAKEVLDDEKKLVQQINSSISSSREMSYNSYKWNKIDTVQTDVDSILQDQWNAGQREIVSGVDNTVTTDRRGITVSNNNDPNRFMRLTNSSLLLTTDGGNTVSLAVNPDGVYAENLVGQAIAGDKLTIASKDGKTQLLGTGLTQYATDGTTERLKLGDISTNQDGSSTGLIMKDQNSKEFFRAAETGVEISGTSLTVSDGGITTSHVSSDFGQTLDISTNTSITSKVSTADLGTEIEQNSDHVKIAVGQIGGNNLLQNTGNFQSLNQWGIRKDGISAATLAIQNGTDNGVTFPALWFTVTTFSSYCNLHNDSISSMKFSTAKKYAFSARLFVSKAMTVQVGIMDANGANTVLGWQSYSLPYGYSTISKVFTPIASGNVPILVIQGLSGTALPYTIVIENCKLEEGENVTAWSPNPNELQQTDVTIDSTGLTVTNGKLTVKNALGATNINEGTVQAVSNSSATVVIDADGETITNGKLTVKNSSGTVVIDGTSNMYKISATGIVNMTVTDTCQYTGTDATGTILYYSHTYQGSITITHNLGYMPTFFVFEQSKDGTSMSTIDDSTTVTVTTTKLTISYYYFVGDSIKSTPDANWIQKYRYYINKEAAF